MPETRRTRIRTTNGPARNLPHAPLADPAVCTCRPILVATFADGDLAEVERRHMRQQGCVRPAEPVDVRAFLGGIRRGRR